MSMAGVKQIEVQLRRVYLSESEQMARGDANCVCVCCLGFH